MAVMDDLVAYWALNEAEFQTAIDSHGDLDLTDVNASVGSAEGKVGTARDFGVGTFPTLRHLNTAEFSLGGSSFTFAGWGRFDQPGIGDTLVSKWSTGTNSREYKLHRETANDSVSLRVSSDGITESVVNHPTTLTFSTWYFIMCRFNAANGQMSVSINGGAQTTATHSGSVNDGTADFFLGSQNGEQAYIDGRMDEWGFWRRVLSTDDETWLYNSGNGRSYADLQAERVTALLSIGKIIRQVGVWQPSLVQRGRLLR